MRPLQSFAGWLLGLFFPWWKERFKPRQSKISGGAPFANAEEAAEGFKQLGKAARMAGYPRRCEACRGTGVIPHPMNHGDPCEFCNGTGVIKQSQ